jgi:hypothetical protein
MAITMPVFAADDFADVTLRAMIFFCATRRHAHCIIYCADFTLTCRALLPSVIDIDYAIAITLPLLRLSASCV